MKKIAIVVQRYGKGVLGGSESLARDIASMLSSSCDVEVLTTCAIDYTTWSNQFPEGESVDDGIIVRRFKVDRHRSLLFKPLTFLLMHLPHTMSMEELWMQMQGPASETLKKHIIDHRKDYDLYIFLTYLYWTTYECLPPVKDMSVLVPTAHDEPFIRFGIFHKIFEAPKAVLYLTEEEKGFVENSLGIKPGKGIVLGAPVKTSESSAEDFRKKYGIEGDFILYVGRLETMKGVKDLVHEFKRYRRERKSTIQLVLCGKGPVRIEKGDGILPLGYVPDEDKNGAIKAALAVVQPSKYESFSYTLMESMIRGTPVIANAKCDVLRAHCERSGGGFSYASYEEFKSALDSLLSDSALRQKMGTAGMVYVKDHYTAEAVGRKYISTIDGLVDRKQDLA